MDDQVIAQIIEWEQSKRRSDGHFDLPISGFGAPPGLPESARATLWLPTPSPARRVRFIKGLPVAQTTGDALDVPEIRDLRDYLIRSIEPQHVGGGAVSIDIAFLRYTALCLLVNYALTDEDLTALLDLNLSDDISNRWTGKMMDHLYGGRDVLESACRLAPQLVMRQYAPPPEPPAPPRAGSPRRGWLRRLRRGNGA